MRLLFGYGVPGLIVTLTLALTYILQEDSAFCHDEDADCDEEMQLCWLKQGNFIWAFVGPAAVIICFNIFVMVRASRVALRARKRFADQGRVALIQGNLKSLLILTFLLGVTWSAGFLIRDGLVPYSAYLFVALNGSVGIFIFIHTVLLNETVMAEVKLRFNLIDRENYSINHGGDRSRALRRTMAAAEKSVTVTSSFKKASRKSANNGKTASEKRAPNMVEYVDYETDPSTPDVTSIQSSGSMASSGSNVTGRRRQISVTFDHQGQQGHNHMAPRNQLDHNIPRRTEESQRSRALWEMATSTVIKQRRVSRRSSAPLDMSNQPYP